MPKDRDQIEEDRADSVRARNQDRDDLSEEEAARARSLLLGADKPTLIAHILKLEREIEAGTTAIQTIALLLAGDKLRFDDLEAAGMIIKAARR